MEIEYKIHELHKLIMPWPNEEEEVLARYGAQGWQLVTVRGVADILLYYFSRPKRKE